MCSPDWYDLLDHLEDYTHYWSDGLKAQQDIRDERALTSDGEKLVEFLRRWLPETPRG